MRRCAGRPWMCFNAPKMRTSERYELRLGAQMPGRSVSRGLRVAQLGGRYYRSPISTYRVNSTVSLKSAESPAVSRPWPSADRSRWPARGGVRPNHGPNHRYAVVAGRRGAGLISAAVPRGRRIRGVPIWALAGMHTGGPGMHTGVFVIPGITERARISRIWIQRLIHRPSVPASATSN